MDPLHKQPVLLFFAYTGFEVIAIAAEDMKNPKKNLPRAIIMCMLLVSVLYMAILAVSIGVLGSDLANTKAPVQDAFNVILGPIGMYIVLAGTLISMGGINFAEAITHRVLQHPWLKMACYQMP